MTKGEETLEHLAREMTQAMREVTRAVDTQNIQWPQMIDTLNSQFVLHNAKTDELGKYVQACTTENQVFRTEIWGKMWGLFEKVVFILAAMAGGAVVLKVIFGV